MHLVLVSSKDSTHFGVGANLQSSPMDPVDRLVVAEAAEKCVGSDQQFAIDVRQRK